MTKQEVIREGIAERDYIRTYKVGLDLLSGFAGEVTWQKAPDRIIEKCYRHADREMEILASQGAVIKAGSSEDLKVMLMNTTFKKEEAEYSDVGTLYLTEVGVARVIETVEEAGYESVESLIENPSQKKRSEQ